MTIYKKEIISVFDDEGVGIGFIARRYVIFGVHDGGDRWCFTSPNGNKHRWKGSYSNRKAVVKALSESKSIIKEVTQ